MMWKVIGVLLAVATVPACRGKEEGAVPAPAPPAAGETYLVRDTVITATFEAAGVAEPVRQATLATRLMGSVTEVPVREGDRVGSGQVLARIDTREMDARRAQVEAGIAAAEAVYRDAQVQAERFRGLYADSAATRYQLDQVETGLARAEAGLTTARAAKAEVAAVTTYGALRAPFAGTVTRRYVDPGAFAAPGTPIVEVQDASRLRVRVSVPPRVASALRRGAAIAATIEGAPADATIEGVVPASGATYTVNALVDNRAGRFLTGSAATLAIPDGTRHALLVPAAALVQQGDLVGVRVREAAGDELRWVRTGATTPTGAPAGGLVEILSGLTPGDLIVLGGR
jgi:RND family efflux transporter MFP subunit